MSTRPDELPPEDVHNIIEAGKLHDALRVAFEDIENGRFAEWNVEEFLERMHQHWAQR